MKTQTRVRILVVVLALSLNMVAFSARPQAANFPTPLSGQTATLLPDGSWLLLGGQDVNGHPLATLIVRNPLGNEQQLQLSLQFARMWHTATVLPDGTVLILGGIGVDGRVVQQAEIFDPVTQMLQSLGSGAPAPRAFHTATLLTDGRVLIAGGTGLDGEPVLSAELWDPRQKSSIIPTGQLNVARHNHLASLLPDGRVLLSGGKDAAGNTLSSGELYDPQFQTFSPIANPQSQLTSGTGITEDTATSPDDGATDVPVSAIISMRFSRPLRTETINNQTLLLEGPTGIVESRIVGAEGGMLAFITPKAALLPGTNYSVRFSGAVDNNNATAAFMEFSFTTAGEAPSGDEWIPDIGWMSNRPTSKFQSLPPLEAGVGVTALAGQVLKLDGTPLQHVTLMIGDRKAVSDGTGRFLLTNVPSGHSSMMILGNTANTSTRGYGIYEVGVDVKSGITNVLRYIIWMTPLDTAHAVKIPSPTTSETVIATPLLPGLELHLPSNTVITDYYGKPVTEISITPIPLDRPPFPLPNAQVPLYFTIQPGSAYIKVMSSTGSKGARLFYPNAYGYPPGTTYNFWNYDPDKRGWYIYGQGRVSADRSQVIPNPGVVIYEFTGAMVEDPGGVAAGGPGGSPPPGPDSQGGEPVDLATGLFIYKQTDLVLPDVIPIALTRVYRPGDSVSHAFGIGTTIPYDVFNVGDNSSNPEGYTFQDLILSDSSSVHFQRISPCTGANGFCDLTDGVFEHTSSPTSWFGATIRNQSGCPLVGNVVWTLRRKDGTVLCFPDSFGKTDPRAAAVIGIQDRYGNAIELTRDSNHNLTFITSPNGRWIHLTYDGSNRVAQATDNVGRIVTYSYDGGGRLTRVVDANGGVWNYSYDALNQMLSIQDPRGIFYLTNQYDANGRVIRQTQADNSVFTFGYTTDLATGNITQTDYTDPRGFVRRTAYNASHYKTGETFALGQPEQQTITYNRDSNTNLVNSVTDALLRQTSFGYDSLGNLTSVTGLAGTPNAVTTVLTYDPIFSQVASITDPLNNTTTFSRDGLANLSAITDPLGHQTTFTYNSQGLPLSATDALGNIAQFTYSGADLVTITDPLGNTTTRFVDSAGRVASITDALGRATRMTYNALNKPLTMTDPLQGVISFAYDPNGNLLSLTDALNHTTSWTYNDMDRVATQTDPLQRQQVFSYDQGGNLASATDRKGQVTTLQYDGLNRRTLVGFGTQASGSSPTYASTISYTYDGGNRMRQAADSVGGTITQDYDDLDRLTSESTSQGSITYTYDNAGRRASMTVPCASGVPACAPVTYGWDNANRLTQISQASSNVTIGYDDANRRSSLALPNGVEVLYGYDADSRLKSLMYNLGVNTLGNLTYSYDQVGHRTQVSGSFARTSLPQPVTSASYDTANQLVSWGGTSPIYDPNGSMLSDGTNAFTWNARNQLAALNGVNLQYDSFARRTQTLAGTSFLYDGRNAVQELTGTTVTANLLNGGVDEVFARSDAAGTLSQLRDALGSTIALTDLNGNIATAYTYGPHGLTSSAGASSSNTFQYTGRENEGNGLYYYRARYYTPRLGRFVSEDPLGFRAGHNFYSYVGNDPIDFVDPSGADKQPGGESFVQCAVDLANDVSPAHLLGIQNRFGKAVLGNSWADGVQALNDLSQEDLRGALENGENVAIDRGFHHGTEALAHSILPDTTHVAVAIQGKVIRYGGLTYSQVAASATVTTEEAFLPALLGRLNVLKNAYDLITLGAAGAACALF